MGTATTWADGQLLLIFQNTNFGGLGDATGLRGSTTVGSIYLSLHSADPGAGGNQSTNEISYTGYARLAVARTNVQWSESSGVVTNLLELDFGLCTVGSANVTHVGIGTDPSGSGKLMFSGAVSTPRSISAGVEPRFSASALTVTIT